ncbi:MAG: riboflavin synthase [Chitinivibrionales bacterium]|nr:riboflavin synthase [Chitinivibrionales bacterium]
MFTGLIETTGLIKRINKNDRSVSLEVEPLRDDFDVQLGQSVAIDGVCLTVESIRGKRFRLTAVAETLSRTTLSRAREGICVNLERSLRVSDRLDGHFVLGHVDCVGSVISDRHVGNSIVRTIQIPPEYHHILAEKGSVAVDGISLTIAESKKDSISISFIPYTMGATNAQNKKSGDRVNIECDIVARYIFHLIKSGIDIGAAGKTPPPSGTTLLDKLESWEL